MKQKLSVKLLFAHVIREKLFETTPELFNENSSVKSAYKIIKSYYERYNKEPTKETVLELLKTDGVKATLKEIELLYNSKEYNKIDMEWFGPEFDSLLQWVENKEELMIGIDKNRSYELWKEENDKKTKNDKEDEEDDDIDLKNTPTFDSFIYDNIPSFFKKYIDIYSDTRTRDVLLTSLLTTTSSLFPSYSTYYHNSNVYPNLFSFIVAPAASGKGTMNKAGETLKVIQENFNKKYDDKLFDYKVKLNDAKKEKTILQNDEEPRRELTILPANSSSAAMIDILDGQDSSLIFETEADTLIAVSRNDWGNFSDSLRKAFHHEQISKLRKGGDYIMIDEPKLSMLLGGTPDQPVEFIGNTQNGLFSRFIFYSFSKDLKWISGFKSRGSNNKQKIKKAQNYLATMVETYSDLEINFELTEEQQETFNNTFSDEMINTNIFYGKNAADVSIRNGIKFLRIAMLLSLFNYQDTNLFNSSSPEEIICTDLIFDVTMKIINVLNKHSMLMFNNMNKTNITKIKANKEEQIMDQMPEKFKKSDYMSKCKEHNIDKNKVERIMSKLKKSGKIKKIDYYTWKKK